MIALALVLALTAHTPPAAKAAPQPSKAVQAGAQAVLSGVRVTLACTAFADGHVGDCSVERETHPGLGFGEAAVALMDGATLEPVAGARDERFQRTIEFTP